MTGTTETEEEALLAYRIGHDRLAAARVRELLTVEAERIGGAS